MDDFLTQLRASPGCLPLPLPCSTEGGGATATNAAHQGSSSNQASLSTETPVVAQPGHDADPVIAKMRRAAVLIPLFQDEHGKVRCLLTVRSSRMRSHAGEVCFPGGKCDEEDATVVETALREAEEEIGLPRSEVEVVGVMSPALSLHLLHVTPVVAVIRSGFDLARLTLNPEEVETTFDFPIESMLNPPRGTYSFMDLDWYRPWRMHTFRHREFNVWGLTAEVLLRLCLLTHPSHSYNYEVTHSDGTDMEHWFRLALQDASLRRDIENPRHPSSKRRKKAT